MVYVDRLQNYGWRLGPSCHLIADSLPELHGFAARLGLRFEWFQLKSSPHYDLTASKRKRALELGAVELDRSAFVAKIRELRAQRQG